MHQLVHPDGDCATFVQAYECLVEVLLMGEAFSAPRKWNVVVSSTPRCVEEMAALHNALEERTMGPLEALLVLGLHAFFWPWPGLRFHQKTQAHIRQPQN